MKNAGVAWVGKIPENWTIRRIKDVCELVGGSTPNAEEIGEEFDLHWATPTDFQDITRILAITSRKITAVGHLQISKTLVREGSVLISCRAPAGKVAYISSSLSFNQGCKGLTPRKDIDGVYLFYLMVSMRSAIESEARGTTFQEISGFNLGRLKIATPSLSEQRAIADYLDQQTALIDQRLSTLEKKKTVLTELRQTTIHEAVTQGATWNVETGQIENLPNGWEATQAKRLLCFITSGSRGWAEYYADEGDIFLRIGNLTRETIELDLNDVQYVRLPVNATEGSRTRIREGDMLVSITADLGSIAIAPKLDKPAYVNQHIALCRPKSSALPRWLGYAMVSLHTKQQFMNSGYGGTKIQLSLDDVRQVWLAVPPPAEQQAIANHLDQQTQHIAAQLATLDEQAQVLKELRKSIIHEAVTGKIDLSGAVSGKENR